MGERDGSKISRTSSTGVAQSPRISALSSPRLSSLSPRSSSKTTNGTKTRFEVLMHELVAEHFKQIGTLTTETQRLQRLVRRASLAGGPCAGAGVNGCETKKVSLSVEEFNNPDNAVVALERDNVGPARKGDVPPACEATVRDDSMKDPARVSVDWAEDLVLDLEREMMDETLLRLEATRRRRDRETMRIAFSSWARHSTVLAKKVEFVMRAPWNQKGSVSEQATLDNFATMALHQKNIRIQHEDKQDTETEVNGCARFLVSPNSSKRIAWDLAGAVLLCYDMIMIPMLLFELPKNSFTVFMDWFTQIFWTFDCFMSCVTGYISHGITVMQPKYILWNYIKGWFLLDVLVVVPDWFSTIVALTTQSAVEGLEVSEGGGDPSSSSRLLRSLRVLRIARLLRLAKLTKLLNLVKDHIDSEVTFVVVNIFKLITLLLIVNHYLAALWYGIGRLDATRNWVDIEFANGETLLYRYATSVHWSLTQFTPGSMSVQPQNIIERTFALLVLVFGLVLFSSFVSSITASMTQLRGMSEERSKQLWLLRRYLRQRKMSKQLSFRVLRYIEYALGEQKDLVSETRIWVLKFLSTPLRDELNFEVSFRCVNAHPMFCALMEVSEGMMTKLASTALSLWSMAVGDGLFKAGSRADYMHMIVTGELAYFNLHKSHGTGDEDSRDEGNQEKIGPSDWLCEAALWTAWKCTGTAKALQEAKLVQIEANQFCDIVAGDPNALSLATYYAQKYVGWLSSFEQLNLTDYTRQDMVSQLETYVHEWCDRKNRTSRFGRSSHAKQAR